MTEFFTDQQIQFFENIEIQLKKSQIDLEISNREIFNIQNNLQTLKNTKTDFERKLELHSIAATYIQSVIDTVCDNNLKKIEKWVNLGLKDIFYDQDITFRIDKEIKYNKNAYTFTILNQGVEGTKDSYGGGILCVIALILKVIFLHITNSFKLLVFDESLSFLSKQYIEHCAKFIKMLIKEFNITVILVTHQDEFLQFADLKWIAQKKANETILTLED